MSRAWLLLFVVGLGCRTDAPQNTVVLTPAPTSSTSASSTPGTLIPVVASPSTFDSCVADADCTWGEINHEIVTAKDCMCLFGCPYLALNSATNIRRTQAHNKLCAPGMDSDGNRCPIDDCAAPSPIHCANGKCVKK